jgi:hypothetical protein
MMVVLLISLGGNILLGPLLWWHRELFFGLDTVGANVGGSENRKGSPNTRAMRKDAQFAKVKETENLQKSILASKVVNLFTHAHAPPFTGRRRDFLHSVTTLESREYS